MGDEQETRKETDFWGNEKEVVYKNGERTGEIHTEERGGFFGLGAETVRVETDNSGKETSYSKTESRGGVFGVGGEPTEVYYTPEGKETGTSRVEERGGIFGVGSEHIRIERNVDGEEIGQTRWEKRRGFLGLGGEWVKVARSNNQSKDVNQGSYSSSYSSAGGTAVASGGRKLNVGRLILFVLGGIFLFGFAIEQIQESNTQKRVRVLVSNAARLANEGRITEAFSLFQQAHQATNDKKSVRRAAAVYFRAYDVHPGQALRVTVDSSQTVIFANPLARKRDPLASGYHVVTDTRTLYWESNDIKAMVVSPFFTQIRSETKIVDIFGRGLRLAGAPTLEFTNRGGTTTQIYLLSEAMASRIRQF